MDCGPFFFGPRAIRMHLHDGAVEAQRLHPDPEDLLLLQRPVNTRSSTPALAQRFAPVYTACHRPKRFGNASVFVHVQDRVQHVQEGTLV